MAPIWLHGEISKEEAEEKLKMGGCPDGRFLVRERGGAPGEYVLSVNFRGRPTHHLIAHDPIGGLQINRKSYGTPKPATIEQLIGFLTVTPLPAGWPVPLSDPVAATGSPAAALEPAPVPAPARQSPQPTRRAESPKQVRKAESPKQVRREEPAPAPAASGHPWLHGEMTKDGAEELMTRSNPTDGKFFVRSRGSEFPNSYILTVVYKGRPTHHLLNQTTPGQPFTVNGKPTDGRTIEDVVTFLRSTHPFWPVPLKDHVPRASSGATPQSSGGSDESAARERARREKEEQQRREQEEERRRQDEEKRRQDDERRREQERREQERKEREEREEREEQEREERERKEREERERKEKEKASSAFVYQAPNFFSTSPASPSAPAASSSSTRPTASSYQQNTSIAVEDEEDEKTRKQRLLREKRWKDGEQLDVTVRRLNPGASFGFGVAGLWRIDGRTKVISWIDSEGPAAGALQVEDEIISINGDAVEELDLEQVKDVIRNLGNEFKVRIFRPSVKSTAHHFEQPQQLPETKSKGLLTKKSKRPGTRSTKCSGGVWCPCPDCKRQALQEEKESLDLSMRVAERTGGKERLAVVLTRRGADREDYNSYI